MTTPKSNVTEIKPSGINPEVTIVTNVKLPPFWASNPQLWFIQTEIQFAIHKVTTDVTKYCLTVAALPAEACETVFDFLMKPPEVDKYETLKTAIISRHTLTLLQ